MTGTRPFLRVAAVLLAGLPALAAAQPPPASPEPVQITLASTWIYMFEEGANAMRAVALPQRLVLRVPPAYVHHARFTTRSGINQHADAASAITFSVWSRSLDPVLPDRIADSAACPPPSQAPCAPPGTDGGRVAGRVAGGEFPLEILLHNATSTPVNQRFQIRSHVGLVVLPPLRLPPCEFREDPALGMLVGRPPEGPRIFDACNIGTPGITDPRTGRFFDRATFLMREADGTPKFGVRCPVFVGPDDGALPGSCDLLGYFGVWPIEMSVPSHRVGEWSAIFDRVQDFLTRHVVSRTGRTQ